MSFLIECLPMKSLHASKSVSKSNRTFTTAFRITSSALLVAIVMPLADNSTLTSRLHAITLPAHDQDLSALAWALHDPYYEWLNTEDNGGGRQWDSISCFGILHKRLRCKYKARFVGYIWKSQNATLVYITQNARLIFDLLALCRSPVPRRCSRQAAKYLCSASTSVLLGGVGAHTAKCLRMLG